MTDPQAARDEEIRKVLELVAAGELTPEGADALLDAIHAAPAPPDGGTGQPTPPYPPPTPPARPARPAPPPPPAAPRAGAGPDLSRELRRLSREARRISHEAQKAAKHEMKDAIREAKDEIRSAFRLTVTEAAKAAQEVETELRRVFTNGNYQTGEYSWLSNLAGMNIARDRVKHVAQVRLEHEVGPEERVSVRNAAGDVVIKSWDEPRVEVRGDLTGWGIDKEMAQDRAESIPLEVQQRDGEIVVEARPPVPSGMGLFNLQRMACDLHVMVPRRTPLSAAARSGDIIVEDHDSDLSLNTTGGDVVVSGAGGNVEAETVQGDITVRDSRAGNLTLTSVSGDITIFLSPQPGGDYRLRSARGDVHAHVAPDNDVECDLETVSGDLNVGGPFSVITRERGRIRCAVAGPPAPAGSTAATPARLKIVTISGDASVS